MKRRMVAVAAVALLLPLAASNPGISAQASTDKPLWLTHVENFPGGLSAGVRAVASRIAAAPLTADRVAAPAYTSSDVQINNDSEPPMPQNETSVAVSLDDPKIAVVGANDYVSGGVAVMRTLDGGVTWSTTRVNPVFRPTSDVCSGGDPVVAYSLRDKAFYLSQLCFFRSLPFSEIQVFKSEDNGLTWTPGRRSSVAASNYDAETGAADESVFHDKEWMTVDNTPTSPHYGRVYVSWTKFHLQDDGFSDYCPIQVAYTDIIPTFDPSLATWEHTPVVPDNPGDDGVGSSANQFSVPQVDETGDLTISYALEECNTGLDHGFRYQRSDDGGETFLRNPVKINKPGQFVDNPDPADLLPPTAFRAPNTTAHAISPRTGTTVFVYQNHINRERSEADISFQVSSNGGLDWSDAETLSARANGRPAQRDQFFPWVTVDEAGVFYAVWFDRRNSDINKRIETWYAVSTDDADTWTSERISTRSWNPDEGFFTSGAFIGDYNGIAASKGWVYPVWTDGRRSAIERTGIGETDVFTSVQRS